MALSPAAIVLSRSKTKKAEKRSKAIQQGKKREITPELEADGAITEIKTWPSIRLSEPERSSSSRLPGLCSKDGR